MREEILKRLREILIRDFRIPEASLGDDASFRKDLRLDTLSLVDLIYLVQKDFGFKAEISEFADAHTVSALVDLISRKRNAPP